MKRIVEAILAAAVVTSTVGLASAQPPPPSEPASEPAPTEPSTREPAEPAPAPPPEAPAPAPEPAPAAPGSYAAIAAQSGGGGGGPAPTTGTLEERLEKQVVIGVLRVGFRTVGSGEIDTTCDESGTPNGGNTPSCSDDTVDYDDKAGVAVGADLLFRATPKLRLGLGSLVVLDPKYEVQIPGYGGYNFESGTEVSAFAVVEGMFPVGDSVGLSVRGNVGATALFAGNEHRDAIDNSRDACKASSFDTCNRNEGPYFGPMFGLGIGVLIQAGAVGLRIDTLGEYVGYTLFDETQVGGGVTAKEKTTLRGSRGFLFVGVEI